MLNNIQMDAGSMQLMKSKTFLLNAVYFILVVMEANTQKTKWSDWEDSCDQRRKLLCSAVQGSNNCHFDKDKAFYQFALGCKNSPECLKDIEEMFSAASDVRPLFCWILHCPVVST